MRYKKTVWGLKVYDFAMRHGVTVKEIAKACNLNYHTLRQVCNGRTSGIEVLAVEKVEAYMEHQIKNVAPNTKPGLQKFGEEDSPCIHS